MSHWMTSGSDRLKAKQNRSFEQRARQRAALLAPDGHWLGNVGKAHKKRFRQPKSRRHGAKLMNCIRGDPDRHCDGDSLPVLIRPRRRIRDPNSIYLHSSNVKRTVNQTARRSCDCNRYAASQSHAHSPAYARHPSNRSFCQQHDSPVYNHHTSNGVYDDKVQNVPSQYASSHGQHPATAQHPSIQRRDSPLYNHHTSNGAYDDKMQNVPSPYTVSHRKYSASAQHPSIQQRDSPLCNHHTSNRVYDDTVQTVPSQHTAPHGQYTASIQHPSMQQRDFPVYNHHTNNGAYDDKVPKLPYQFLRPHMSGRESVAPDSHGQLLSSIHYRNNDFESDSQKLEESQQQQQQQHNQNQDPMICNNIDDVQFTFDNAPIQKGFKRFQKSKRYHPDQLLVADESKNNPFGPHMSGSESIAPYSHNQLSSSIHYRNNDFESDSQTFEHSQLQQQIHDTTIYQNTDARFLFDDEPIQKGIKMFQKRKIDKSDRSYNDSLRDISNSGNYDAFRARRLQYEEGVFEQTMSSNITYSFGSDPGCLDVITDKTKSSASSLLLFDNQNEKDVPANLPYAQMHRSTDGELRDDMIGKVRPSIAGQHGNENIDEVECQQTLATSTSSLNTDYLKGFSFGNESICRDIVCIDENRDKSQLSASGFQHLYDIDELEWQQTPSSSLDTDY